MEEMTNKMIQQSMGIDTTSDEDEGSSSSAGYLQMFEDYMKGQ